ncbi:DNA methylase N-4/N-6, partial [uncultured Caudovirales phage]
MRYEIHNAECLAFMRTLPSNHVDAIVTDPPYELGFMGKTWDKSGIANNVEMWAEALRILKPGGHLLAFSGSRTYHRMTCAIEDAGFEVRDQIMWVYGSGFPKSMDVSKAIDKMDAAEEQKARRFRFTAWVKAQGVTAKQIDEATGTMMGNHYTTHPTQPAIMTREHLEDCRHLFVEVPDWIEKECDIRSVESKNFAEREVVGYNVGVDTTKQSIACASAAQGFETSTRREFAITTANTEEARRWQGWGTSLKPAHEPICVARKPLEGTVARNVLTWGTGAVNVDGCRVEGAPPSVPQPVFNSPTGRTYGMKTGEGRNGEMSNALGRWPANLIHDGSEEVVALFPETTSGGGDRNGAQKWWFLNGVGDTGTPRPFDANSGSAARFFYCAKASKRDRDEGCEGLEAKKAGAMSGIETREGKPTNHHVRTNHHPTVKPCDLMRYLCRLVTPPGGLVFDPFTGSGSTGKAAVLEGFDFLGCDMTPEYVDIARARIQHAA